MSGESDEQNEIKEENVNDEEIFKLKVELKSLKIEKERITESSRKLKAVTIKLKEKLEEKTKAFDELTKEIEILKNSVKEKEEHHRENSADLNDKLINAEKEQRESKEIIDKLYKQLEESNLRSDKIKSDYDKLKEEYENYKNKVDYLWKQKKDDVRESSSHNNDIGEMVNIIRLQNTKITELEGEKNSLEAELGLFNESYKKLKNEFTKEKQEGVKKFLEIEEDFERKLKDKQKYFDDERNSYQQSLLEVNNNNQLLQKQIDNYQKQIAALENQLSTATLLQSSVNRQSFDVDVKLRSHSPEVKSILLPKFEPAFNIRSNIETEMFLNSVEDFSVDDTTSPPIDGNDKFNLRTLLNDNSEDLTEVDPFNLDKWRGVSTEEEITLEHYEEALLKIKHFESLLKDSEIWNSQLEEQVKFLKGELRRLTNNEERMQHLKNIEYVKDVIIKFFKDEKVENERKQLIPIMKTLLKLSNDEVDVLESFASKHALNNTSTTTSDWGSYFKSFTGS
uniref:GRIP domain-containing protein n=1 Tax=Parastrongyloides trichosuri TaxID=131310 RepID=A0A0N4ZST1_PARTI